MENQANQARPFLRILYECCQIYQRIYRSRDGQTYQGRCPGCLRAVRFRVGSGGTSARAFKVY